MIVQTENDKLVRDTGSRALFSKREDLMKFREKRQKEQKIETMEDRINSLESKMDRILALLESK